MGQYFQSWQNFVFDCRPTVDHKKFIISSIKNSSLQLQPYDQTGFLGQASKFCMCDHSARNESHVGSVQVEKMGNIFPANNGEFCFLTNFDDLTCLKLGIIILRPEMGITPQYWSESTYHMIVITDYQIFCFQKSRWRLSWILGKTGANWDTFVIYRPGADNNRVRDSKQLCNLGLIFVIVTRAFNK